MTLDEAIIHAEEVTEDKERNAGWFYDKERASYKKKCIKCAEEHRQLAEWLKELKQLREQTRWIPVSERLPEEREWYLAVFKEKDTGFQLIPRVADYRGENNWEIIDEDGLVKEYRDILECVAWMPLPQPYKAESEEANQAS